MQNVAISRHIPLMKEVGNVQDYDNIDLLHKSLSLMGNVFFWYAFKELKVNSKIH